MDLASTSSQTTLENTAYKSQPERPLLECSWCQKQGHYSKGHIWKTCRRLKAFKEKKKPEKGNSATTSEATAFLAHLKPSVYRYWVFDTGATAHLTSDRTLFTPLLPHSGYVTFADGNRCPIGGIGSIILPIILSDDTTSSLILKDTLYIPSLGPISLLS